jgi:probable nitrogen fixation protein
MQTDPLHPDPAAEEASFLHELARQLRSEHGDAAWDGREDREVLAPLLRGPPDPDDPDVFWRIEVYFAAVGRTIERLTGVPCRLLMRMHGDGDGIVVLLARRLVAVCATVHDAHGFAFPSLERLAAAGARHVAAGVRMIERFPEAARTE